MIDLVKLNLIAGNGGNGKVSFRREKYVPKGGPDGGYGGDGGSIIFQGDKSITTLKQLSGVTEIAADNGQMGGKRKRHGADAPDQIIKVPVGTTIWVIAENNLAKKRRGSLGMSRQFTKSEIHHPTYHLEKEGSNPPLREEDDISHIYDNVATDTSFRLKNINLNKVTKHKLVEISEDGQQITVCQGGFGGRGNIAFKNSRNTTPLEAEYGTYGEQMIILAELKLLADVGMVGYPNAGKSTLISKLTKASPKVGAYPFTTITPNLGILETSFGKELVLADIPGLVEGASEGKGLGHSFLRHVEACKVILYVLSLSEDIVFDDTLTPEQKAEHLILELNTLRKELTEYSDQMLAKPYLISVNKADLYDDELKERITEKFKQRDEKVIIFSGITGENLDKLSMELEKFV